MNETEQAFAHYLYCPNCETAQDPRFSNCLKCGGTICQAWETARRLVAGKGEKMNKVVNKNGKKIDFDAAINLMDDKIRETLANDGKERTEQDFFSAYEKAHEAKYGAEWEISKANPVW